MPSSSSRLSRFGYCDMNMPDTWNINSCRSSLDCPQWELGYPVAGYCSRSSWPLSICCSSIPVPTQHKLLLIGAHSGMPYYNRFLSRYQQRILREDIWQPKTIYCGVLVNTDVTLLPWVLKVGMGLDLFFFLNCIYDCFCFLPFL